MICPFCRSEDTQINEDTGLCHCSLCGSDFGSELKQTDGSPFLPSMTGFFFTIGSCAAAGGMQMIFTETGNGCMYTVHNYGEETDRTVEGRLENDRWNAFKETVCTKLSLNDWKQSYVYNPADHDGQPSANPLTWTMDVISKEQTLTWTGKMDFPGNWAELGDLLQPYADLAALANE